MEKKNGVNFVGEEIQKQRGRGAAGRQGASNWGQFKILMKKNFWLQKRSYVGTCCELVLPIVITFITVAYFAVFAILAKVDYDIPIDS